MNNLKELKPRMALNKAFLKVKPNRSAIEGFKANLITLLDRTNDTESEEFHKNLISDFLKKTYYDPNHFINTKGRNDLVIHNGQNANSTVGVILEAKKPTNKNEMVSVGNLNRKAFQELVLYYLRERITHKNLDIKHLVITNINEWFIFDEHLFERLFAQNKSFVRQFEHFEVSKKSTEVFYKEIAEPFIEGITAEIAFTYFHLQNYQNPLRNDDKADDNKLIALFKLLSPEHLLKLPFANDSNSLDKRFYSELLHIIGLIETKEGGKKLIGRNKEGDRNSGSILENAIIQLDSLDKIGRLDRPDQFGSTHQERLFNVALELSITWVNRILFLKLLEAQLITYHRFDKLTTGKGEKSYSFLNLDKIKNYDDLNSLFFQVLARKYEERNPDVGKLFEKVPYLNSSLFEPTDIEHSTLFISNLRDDKTIPILSSTVLKDNQGKKRTGQLSTLEYLFAFLDAYDFGAEGGEDIQEDNKTLINASVLGLIFEKINGYKDGSFFTPGFITMYMCRETIRKAVVQKFNEAIPPHLKSPASSIAPPLERTPSSITPPLERTPPSITPPLERTPPSITPPLERTPPSITPPLERTPPSITPPLERGPGGVSYPSTPQQGLSVSKRRKIIPYNPKLKEFARQLRNNPTPSEAKVWKGLKGKVAAKYDFHRQKPLDNYIADFFCYELQLVIEIDGEIHNWEEIQQKDFEKEHRLNELGLNVLRFSNNDVNQQPDFVEDLIMKYIEGYEKRDLSYFDYEDSHLNPYTGAKVGFEEDFTHPLAPSQEGEQFVVDSPSQEGEQFVVESPSQEGEQYVVETPSKEGEQFVVESPSQEGEQYVVETPSKEGEQFVVDSLSQEGEQFVVDSPSQEGEQFVVDSPSQEGEQFVVDSPSQEGERLVVDSPYQRGEQFVVHSRTKKEGQFAIYSPSKKEERFALDSASQKEERFKTLDDVYEEIGDDRMFTRKQANDIINSIKICDPAVGSGHFLVSALNEMIAVKNDLKILQDRNGRRLKEYQVEVVNDELIITDEDGELFEYNPGSAGSPANRESQRIQETLFHEKQTIIENCLFGVDINPNSVKICRLRLWIELLKNAYYLPSRQAGKNSTELETLPNIDINIKCGNSLVSRFALDADLKQALKKSRWTIDSYRIAVATYRNAESKEQKREMERLILDIKSNFRSEINKGDPKRQKINRLQGELFNMMNQQELFEVGKKEKELRDKRIATITKEVEKLESEIEEIKSNKIFENAFEWRFEFPEVLNDEGDFVGFDVVIGNPPYVQLQSIKETSMQLQRFEYKTYSSMGDLYALFYERGNDILQEKGVLCYITGSAWMRTNYGQSLRTYFNEETQLLEVIDLSDCEIFESATVLTSIISFTKRQKEPKPIKAIRFTRKDQPKLLNLADEVKQNHTLIPQFPESSWVILESKANSIKEKVQVQGKQIKDWDIKINRGILTGFNDAFVIDSETKENLIAADPKSEELIKPLLRGRDVHKYYFRNSELFLIGTFPSLDLDIDLYPAIKSHLENYLPKLNQTGETFINSEGKKEKTRKKTSGEWFETQDSIAYWEDFAKPKIIYPNMTKFLPFTLDLDGNFLNDKCFILSGEKIYFLVAFLNSKVFHFCFADAFPELQGNSKEIKKFILETIPIKEISDESPFKVKVEEILTIKKQNPTADTTDLEKQIDQLVYELYGLTEEEIKIVEQS